MAERGESNEQKIGFKAIQLFKDQNLGIGGYGAVCKAKCDDLLCAAKILHPTLFDPIAHQKVARRREHRLPIKRFEQECEFMSAIRHPNIVQYLCMYQDPDTGLPVLLMELMDNSLTHFLESSTQPIPYHIQVNVCHDITLALSFLHSNKIIHRDLSGNNVLLIGNIRAKVTDFGMARLGDINPQATRLTFTMCPGTDVYMPPEAVRAQPVYTEKVDCFSFGGIIVQILSRQFPNLEID
jgi:serine/threonine-protein kinase TNNI3K